MASMFGSWLIYVVYMMSVTGSGSFTTALLLLVSRRVRADIIFFMDVNMVRPALGTFSSKEFDRWNCVVLLFLAPFEVVASLLVVFLPAPVDVLPVNLRLLSCLAAKVRLLSCLVPNLRLLSCRGTCRCVVVLSSRCRGGI